MRKDAKIGFAIGAVLLAVLTVYAIVVPKHNKKSNGVTLVTPPPAVAPSDNTTTPPAPPLGSDSQPANPTTQPVTENGSNSNPPGNTTPPAPGNGSNDPMNGGPVVDAGNNGNNHAEQPHHPDAATDVTPPGGTISPTNPARGHARLHADPHTDVATDSTAKDRTYTIKSGDTLSSIANEIYGNPRYWVAIQRENKSINSNRLKVGEKIQLPDPSIVRPTEVVADGNMTVEPPAGTVHTAVAVEQPADGHTYTVKSGDTLYKIARAELGSPRLADELYALNKDVIGPDKARLKLGMVLKLPAQPTSSSARIASLYAVP